MILTFALAIGLILLCALLLGIGRLLKSKRPFSCRRCGNPEKKECDVCDKKNHK